MTDLHPTIAHLPMPTSIQRLGLTDNGYPRLFFAAKVDGKLDLRVADPRKLVRCLKERLCWICGMRLGGFATFVLGPMCTVTRTTADPPSHHECAEYAVKACPFLTRPRAGRREANRPDNLTLVGMPIDRNPGVSALWVTDRFDVWQPPGGGILMSVGDPVGRVEWWAEGRQATYSEVTASLESGLPLLFAECEKDDDPAESRADLVKRMGAVLPLLRGLPGREDSKGKMTEQQLDEAVLVAVRAEELAWFASHPGEDSYIRPAYRGEHPPEITPTHVQVKKLDAAGDQRAREFGVIQKGQFVVVKGDDHAPQRGSAA